MVGEADRGPAAPEAVNHRAKCYQAARTGVYDKAMEGLPEMGPHNTAPTP